MKKRLILILGGFIIMLAACNKEEKYVNYLDIQLEEVLFNASNGKGKNYFKLPNERSFSEIPQDIKNPLTEAKVELGKLLFHETGLAVNPRNSISLGTYSCASCHFAGAGFQAGIKQGIGEGGVGFGLNGEGRFHHPTYALDSIDTQPLRTPSALNSAYQTNQLWNGQFGATGLNRDLSHLWKNSETPVRFNKLGFDGLETQAIAGLNVHRMDCTEDVIKQNGYDTMFDIAFSNVPQTERYSTVNAGLAIAAYERTLFANQAPFQKWLQGSESAMSDDEKRGAILFFEKANCVQCHTGPALNSMDFYAYGMDDLKGDDIIGYSPEKTEHKGRGGFTRDIKDDYKFKVPQLYNLVDSKFYGHGGSFSSVKDVVEYKNTGEAENPVVPKSQLSNEFKPLHLTEQEVEKLVLFLENSLYDSNLNRYEPAALPSGNCFPNSDEMSMNDLSCK